MSGALGEGLFAPGTIRLFGRLFAGLTLGPITTDPASNNPLQTQLAARAQSTDPANRANLARIYAFSYSGNYIKLAQPVVFLVYGPGAPIVSGFPTTENSVDQLGLEFKGGDFSDTVRMWTSDQLDVAVRIDITIGWMKDVLLAEETTGDNNITGGDQVRRADIVGRDGMFVGRDGMAVGRDGMMVGRDGMVIGRRRG
jgi:hypothetical protein